MLADLVRRICAARPGGRSTGPQRWPAGDGAAAPPLDPHQDDQGRGIWRSSQASGCSSPFVTRSRPAYAGGAAPAPASCLSSPAHLALCVGRGIAPTKHRCRQLIRIAGGPAAAAHRPVHHRLLPRSRGLYGLPQDLLTWHAPAASAHCRPPASRLHDATVVISVLSSIVAQQFGRDARVAPFIRTPAHPDAGHRDRTSTPASRPVRSSSAWPSPASSSPNRATSPQRRHPHQLHQFARGAGRRCSILQPRALARRLDSPWRSDIGGSAPAQHGSRNGLQALSHGVRRHYPPLTSPSARRVSILTYNVHSAVSTDGAHSIETHRHAVIINYEPDIVLPLQEIDVSRPEEPGGLVESRADRQRRGARRDAPLPCLRSGSPRRAIATPSLSRHRRYGFNVDRPARWPRLMTGELRGAL